MIVALMSPPGGGKTTMAVKTALKKPVHVIDIDRKLKHQFADEIKNGIVTYWELNDTFQEDKMAGRLLTMLGEKDKQQPNKPPRGWTAFCNYGDSLERDPVAKNAGTIVIDSYTVLALHMRAHMQFLSGKTKLAWDSWSA